VGSRLGVSADAPYLDCAYKLVEYAGRGRLKLSPGKEILPGGKQVFRLSRDGEDVGDVIALEAEAQEEVLREARDCFTDVLVGDSGAGDVVGRPLLEPVMRAGRRLAAGRVPLEEARRHAAASLARLPAACRALEPAEPAYPVTTSVRLQAEVSRLHSELQSA
jgi:nicotinate phosphoribosyltransferase